MYGPITLGRKGDKIQWINYNILCKRMLGYVPAENTKLTKEQLHRLGFLYACGQKKLGSNYGRVDYLL